MAQLDKLLQRICGRPPDARFRDVEPLLEARGWVLARRRGSHVSFTKRGELPITVPIRDGRVGRVYLDAMCSRLELDLDSDNQPQ
jgi:predicted RNA binding protein YcfA (HicA-like mRNA interferase family)